MYIKYNEFDFNKIIHIKKLKNNFFNVEGFYGGDQQWLADYKYISQFRADHSCSVTVGTNICHYLSQNIEKALPLYPDEPDNIKEFAKNMAALFKYLSPKLWGVPTIWQFSRAIKKFAKTKGVNLKPVYLKGFSKKSVIQYIKDALDANCPVALITWNCKIPHLHNHWVTITEIFNTDDTNYITTSNWGSKYIYNFDHWYESDSLYMGLVYFDISQ